ncbi:unnamed protein product [Trichogramma brassicae]|uniref:Glucose-methanol-choline oxidoreductase N-terminal domain-containing protein n=1 Tax=Trichogramma brassicae TaxID=86971 RepID=A0A6H5IUE0_9HYME|nr:unnamed protein product [Trichogramma brassicae]
MTKWLRTLVLSTLLLSSTCSAASLFDYVGGATDIVAGVARLLAESLVYRHRQVEDMTPRQNQEYDFVIVGAGTAGATLAARLTENPNVTVLLVEAGGHEPLLLDVPLLALLFMFYPRTNWGYRTERSNDYCLGMKNRQCFLAVGKVLGGSSTNNFMLATRGNEHNFNKWAKMTGDESWSYSNVLPYFKKLENFQADLTKFDDEYHGFEGPVEISNLRYRTLVADAFVEAGRELGLPPRDYNGPVQQGMHYTQTNQANGERVSANRAYLIPAKNRPNLHVSMGSHATKVLIDPSSRLAYGVEFSKRGWLGFKRRIGVKARNEVILSAGTLNTPKILMLSGVGPKDELRKHDIEVLHDHPRIGKNLIDHITFAGLSYLVDDKDSALGWSTFLNTSNHLVADYFNPRRSGPLSLGAGVEGMGFVDIDNATSTETEPDVEMAFGGLQLGYAWPFHLPFGILSNQRGCIFLPTLLQPKSRGEVLLSSKDPFEHPRILTNWLSHPDDVRRLVKAVRLGQALAKTRAFKRYGATPFARPIPGCEQHGWDTDKYWECAIRTYTVTFWHFTGTCRMGKENDPEAVVNSKLLGVGSIPTRRIFEVRFFAWCGRACARGGAGTTQKEDPGYVISLRSGKKPRFTVRAGSDRITISRSPRRGLTRLAIDGAQHSHDEVRSENYTHKRAPDAGAKAQQERMMAPEARTTLTR